MDNVKPMSDKAGRPRLISDSCDSKREIRLAHVSVLDSLGWPLNAKGGYGACTGRATADTMKTSLVAGRMT